MNRYLVVACEYSAPVGATPCDSEDEAEEIAEEQYNPYKYHTQGSVALMKWSGEREEYQRVRSLHFDDQPEPDDGP